MTRSIKFAFVILILSAVVSFCAMVFITAAQAEILKLPSSMYCGHFKEFVAAFEDYQPMLRGHAGAKSKDLGEVWINAKTGDWFFVQVVTAENIMCVVLGGTGALLPVDQSKEGLPL